MELKDYAVIVSGASSGIGKGCVELLLQNKATVIGFDVNPSPIKSNDYIHFIVAVKDESLIINALYEIDQSNKKINGLVNCAGINSIKKPFYEISLDEWNYLISVNLTGTFLLSKHVSQRMIKQRKGRIVNISCIRSRIFRPNMAGYSASKGGIVALTSAMALDLAPYNIQVNSVAPGLTYTGITEKTFREPCVEEKFKNMIPTGRIAKPEDIANVVIFLLSDNSSYINGETIFVDGGYKISK
jgi:NAD(P)-dependent dehydrogenase (short-subunit alcohol dehydrogenase family)